MKKPSAKRPTRQPSATAPGGPAGIAIRAARLADLQQIAALDATITGVSKRDYWKALIERTSRPRQQEGFFLLAEGTSARGPAVLGFIEGEIRAWEFGSAPCGWVYVLSVHPDARVQGLGQLLLDALTAAFRRAGVRRMRTMVLRNNRLVMQFFRAAGMMAGPYLELEKEIE